MTKKLLILLIITVFLIVGCQRESTNVEDIIATTASTDLEDWSCTGDKLYDENNNFIMDCSQNMGATKPLHCRENVLIKDVGTFGGLCIECFASGCPSSHICGSFDDSNPYWCNEITTKDCTDSDGNDYENKGFVNDASGIVWDDCASDGTLIEFICVNDENDFEEIDCQDEFGNNFICDDGECIEGESPTCTDECDFGEDGCSATKVQRWFCGEDDEDNCRDKVFESCGLQGKICESGECVEAVECSIDSECTEPTCIGQEQKCINNKCSPVGECVDCIKNEECNDNNEETIDSCTDGKCQNKPPFDLTILLWFGIPIAFLLLVLILFLTLRKRRKK